MGGNTAKPAQPPPQEKPTAYAKEETPAKINYGINYLYPQPASNMYDFTAPGARTASRQTTGGSMNTNHDPTCRYCSPGLPCVLHKRRTLPDSYDYVVRTPEGRNPFTDPSTARQSSSRPATSNVANKELQRADVVERSKARNAAARNARPASQDLSATISTSSDVSASSYNAIIDSITSSLSKLDLDDVPGTEAVIVGCLPKNKGKIVQSLPKTGTHSILLLDASSKCVNDPPLPVTYNQLQIQTFIKVTKLSKRDDKIGDKIVEYYVDEFILLEMYHQPLGEELVVAVNNGVGFIDVIGNSFVKPTIVPWEHSEKPIQPGDNLIGNAFRLKPFFHPTIMFDVVCYVKRLEEERKYLEAVERAKDNRIHRAPRDPENMYYMTGLRALHPQEIDRIATNCRDMKTVSFQEAKLYIRDPYIAIARLEKHIRLQSIIAHTLQVQGETTINRSGAHKRISLTVYLTPEDVKRVIFDKSQDTWRVGTDLSVRHPELEKHSVKSGESCTKTYEGGMTIERIDIDKKTKSGTVRFRPHTRSFDLFDMVANANTTLLGVFTIGPSDDFVETIVEALQSQKFEDFVNNKELFDSWRGYKNNEKVAINKLNNPFDINGDCLDDSQVKALRTALANPGFTCIEAPPGSGKTFLIAAMVAAKYQQDGPEAGSICITATTNNAVSNAVDKAHDCFPQIRVTREYSKKMEGEINEKSKMISLREMALHAHRHIDLTRHKEVEKANQRFKSLKQAVRSVSNLEEGFVVLDDLNSADFELRQSFQEAYQPFVIGLTCELVARRSDLFYKKAMKKTDEKTRDELKKFAITHLIMDEASQLPPHLALAAYIMLPALKKVTLIGDSQQLGPYTPLDEQTFAFKMVGAGELGRVGSQNKGESVHLRRVYRSHPRIVEILLNPIYGEELKSGLSPQDRAIAATNDLPRAQDDHRSPVLFVNVANSHNDERGVNQKELQVVLDFIETLRKKNIKGEDVAVVCNHLVQRERIIDALKGKGNFGVMNTSVSVHTVDSFQGKEAKVVLLLTTKTAQGDANRVRSVLQFVANPNRGCVAVSRAQHAVYLFGEWFNLVKTKFWSQFVEGIIEAEAMVDDKWNPSTAEDYIKLRESAAQAPQHNREVHFRGRRHQKVGTPHFYRGRGGVLKMGQRHVDHNKENAGHAPQQNKSQRGHVHKANHNHTHRGKLGAKKRTPASAAPNQEPAS